MQTVAIKKAGVFILISKHIYIEMRNTTRKSNIK